MDRCFSPGPVGEKGMIAVDADGSKSFDPATFPLRAAFFLEPPRRRIH